MLRPPRTVVVIVVLASAVIAARCQSTPTANAPGRTEPPDGRVRAIADAYLNANFHDRVLEDGAVPLTSPREKITNWTNTRGEE